MSEGDKQAQEERAALRELERELLQTSRPLEEDTARAFIELEKQETGDALGSFTLPLDALRADTSDDLSSIGLLPEEEPAPVLRDPLVEHARQQEEHLEQARVQARDPLMKALFQSDPSTWGPSPTQDPSRPSATLAPTPRVPQPAATSAPVASHQLVCSACNSDVPAGLDFCVRCGQPPHTGAVRQMVLEIQGFDSDRARRRFARWITEAGLPHPVAVEALQQRPALLHWRGGYLQARALEHWLSQAGVRLQVHRPHVVETQRLKALWAYIWRQGWWRTGLFSTLAITLTLMVVSSPCWVVMGLLALLALGNGANRSLTLRTSLDSPQLLAKLSGLPRPLALRARALLQGLQDPPARQAISAGLTHYCALQHQTLQLGDSQDEEDPQQETLLAELMEQYLQAGERYQELSQYLDQTRGEDLDQRLRDLLQEHNQASDPGERRRLEEAVSQVQQQQTLRRDLTQQRQKLRHRLDHLTRGVETLRARTLSISLKNRDASHQTRELDEALDELRQEMEVMEEALHEVNRLT